MHKETSCPLIRQCRQGVFKHLTGGEGGWVGFILSRSAKGGSFTQEIYNYTSAIEIDVYFKYKHVYAQSFQKYPMGNALLPL